MSRINDIMLFPSRKGKRKKVGHTHTHTHDYGKIEEPLDSSSNPCRPKIIATMEFKICPQKLLTLTYLPQKTKKNSGRFSQKTTSRVLNN